VVIWKLRILPPTHVTGSAGQMDPAWAPAQDRHFYEATNPAVLQLLEHAAHLPSGSQQVQMVKVSHRAGRIRNSPTCGNGTLRLLTYELLLRESGTAEALISYLQHLQQAGGIEAALTQADPWGVCGALAMVSTVPRQELQCLGGDR